MKQITIYGIITGIASALLMPADFYFVAPRFWTEGNLEILGTVLLLLLSIILSSKSLNAKNYSLSRQFMFALFLSALTALVHGFLTFTFSKYIVPDYYKIMFSEALAHMPVNVTPAESDGIAMGSGIAFSPDCQLTFKPAIIFIAGFIISAIIFLIRLIINDIKTRNKTDDRKFIQSIRWRD
ncbi:MAG: hypothetical protein HF314_16910 [Ignavibacteria bacterium]|jgi:hypothetical protein|nr:hypothetical protein [Ignavibacteria bacterium]MCU7504766.1 hypothetical protein [Ignavibacteria bacterium]MCU7518365.1 hypothetical protein [Ignavibacteria bacterium]